MDRDEPQAAKFRWFRACIAFVLAGGIALPGLFIAAVELVPPFTPDGHPVMAIGHALFALVAAPTIALAAAYAFGRVPSAAS